MKSRLLVASSRPRLTSLRGASFCCRALRAAAITQHRLSLHSLSCTVRANLCRVMLTHRRMPGQPLAGLRTRNARPTRSPGSLALHSLSPKTLSVHRLPAQVSPKWLEFLDSIRQRVKIVVMSTPVGLVKSPEQVKVRRAQALTRDFSGLFPTHSPSGRGVFHGECAAQPAQLGLCGTRRCGQNLIKAAGRGLFARALGVGRTVCDLLPALRHALD